MDRISGLDWVDIGAGKRGFRDENLPNGIQGTVLTAPYMNAVQEELLGIIEASGQVPNAGDWAQLSRALDIRSIKRGGWCPAISATVAAPPGAPNIGDVYAIPVGATGAWAPYAGYLAERITGAWQYAEPKDGHAVGLPDGSIHIRVAGAYVPLVASTLRRGLVGLASEAETFAALETAKAVTPSSLARFVRRQSEDITLYVRSDGNDANDGSANTAAKAFKTIQGAVDRVNGLYSGGGRIVDIRVGAGSFAGFSSSYASAMRLRITGAGNADTLIDGAGASAAVSIFQSGCILQSLRIANADYLLRSHGFSDVRFSDVAFGTAAISQIYSAEGGSIYATGGYLLFGNAPYHALSNHNSYISVSGVPITSANRAYSGAFFYAAGGRILASGNTYGFTATGLKHIVNAGGFLMTGDLAGVPGSIAGTTATGGQAF